MSLDDIFKPINRAEDLLDHVKDKYFYCAVTGEIKNKKNLMIIGKSSSGGRDGKYKRIKVCLKGKAYDLRLHHVVWFFNKGVWPIKPIDHIDGDTHNNRFENLIETSQAENIIARNIRNGWKEYFPMSYPELPL